jgi:hypothetical protein
MLVVAAPDSVSVTVTGSEYVFDVLLVAVVENEKMLSPGVTSPFVPSSKKACVADPPIPDRSAVTAIPVLAVPGVTVTVSRVIPPEVTVEGFAAPVALRAPVVPPNDELRGFGVPTVKSAELTLVSVFFASRLTEVVLLGAAVGAPPSKQFAPEPNPTKSTIWPSVGLFVEDPGHAPVSAVVTLTSATLPAVALIAIEPVASAVGNGVVPPVPFDSWTRYQCPG